MAIWGAQGIRDSIRKAYRKHLRMLEEEAGPEEGVEPHHVALHGALLLRYAAAYRAKPGALVWLELGPFLALDPEPALDALAEYVVFKERPRQARRDLLKARIREGLRLMTAEDQQFFLSAARRHRFAWSSLAGQACDPEH